MADRGFGVAPLASGLLADPVAFLSAEHARQMALLGHLDRLVRAPMARGARMMAQVLLRWLTEELPVHIADEERSLYPRLRPHDTAGTIHRLSGEHRRDARLVAEVVRGLRDLAVGGHVGRAFLSAAADFVRGHRQHLELEEAAVAPLARAVLDADAMAALALEMAERRSLSVTACTPAA
jgi:iron-sulfur cluster repair protein YtfE (RIC family)